MGMHLSIYTKLTFNYYYNILNRYIIVATDGLWDVFTSDEVVSFVEKLLRGNRSRFIKMKMAEIITNEALRRGSSDNITVIVQWLG